MNFTQPVSELIRRRSSCRGYQRQPLPAETLRALQAFIDELPLGPLGSNCHFKLAAATESDGGALRGLGTYGAIRNPAAFIIGACLAGVQPLEDFGWQMEALVLKATDLGLGSCWLGGNFARSSFARHIQAGPHDILPAVVSLGLPLDGRTLVDQAFRAGAGSDRRLPWESLFFAQDFSTPLSREAAGAWALPLEMVRLAPSASNKQPWRVIRRSGAWHFYRQRTPGYPGGLAKAVLGVADMQAIDLGIAMCHFELAAAEAGLAGRWLDCEPPVEKPSHLTEYVASWVP